MKKKKETLNIDYAIVGERIYRRRKAKGLTQTSLAKRTGLSNNFISSLERGHERPSLETLYSICEELDTSFDYLIYGSIHSNNISQNIIDKIKLCTSDDKLSLLLKIIDCIIDD